MIIIVEGIDRVGKTTLCEKLSKELGFSIFKDKWRGPTNDQLAIKEKFNTLLNVIATYDNIIIDRFHLTELVYNSFRGDDFEDYSVIDKLLSQRPTLLILVQSEDIEESSRQHGRDLFGHELMFRALFLGTNIESKKKLTYKQFDSYVEVLSRILRSSGG